MNAPVNPKSQRSQSVNSPNEVRAAYVYFHEKRTKNAAGKPFVYGPNHPKAGQPNPRFSGTFMFPKLNADPYQCANYRFLLGLATEAAQKMWPQNVDASGKWVWPQGAQYAVQDGDVPYKSKPKPGEPVPTAEEVAKKNAWRVGYWIVEAENFLDPGPGIAKLINGQVFELPAQRCSLIGSAMAGDPKGVMQYKSGDWGYPCLHAYAYQNETFGINFGFDGFCFTREGDLIGSTGPKTASQMFGNLGAVAPGAPAVGPAPGLPATNPAVAPAPAMPAAVTMPAAPALPGAPNVAAGGMINAMNQMAPPPLPGAAPAAPGPAIPNGAPAMAIAAGLPGLPPIPGR